MNAGRCEYVAASIVESWDELIYLYGICNLVSKEKTSCVFQNKAALRAARLEGDSLGTGETA